jgi:hypothetical protein
MKPDLRQIAIHAARQMQGPKDGAVICNFDRAVLIIHDALLFAAGRRPTQFEPPAPKGRAPTSTEMGRQRALAPPAAPTASLEPEQALAPARDGGTG